MIAAECAATPEEALEVGGYSGASKLPRRWRPLMDGGRSWLERVCPRGVGRRTVVFLL
ncbi:MAG: hypothetical protein ACLU4J_14965 [Butyricimonas paravirosa]